MAGPQTFQIRLEHKVSDALQASFQKLVTDVEASMNQTANLAFQLVKAKENNRRLEKENEQLAAENERLHAEKLKQAEKAKQVEVAAKPAVAEPAANSRIAPPATAVPRIAAAPAAAPAGVPGLYPPVPASVPAAGRMGNLPPPGLVPNASGNFEFVAELRNHRQQVHGLAFDHHGDGMLASASWDASVKLYNLDEASTCKNVVKTLDGSCMPKVEPPQGLYSVAFARTQEHKKFLGCTSCDHKIYLWDYEAGKCRHTFESHTDEVNFLDFHPVQPVMATASDDCKAIVWDFVEGVVLREISDHSKAVYGVKFLGREHEFLLATCCFDQATRIFDMRQKAGKKVATMTGHTDDVIGVDFEPSKGILATGSDDGNILLYDSRMWGTAVHNINTRKIPGLDQNEVKRVAFSPDGRQLAAATSGSVLVYDFQLGAPELSAKLGGHTDCVFDVSWQHNIKSGNVLLASASHDGSCRFWRKGAYV